jgi:hypothetical protein
MMVAEQRGEKERRMNPKTILDDPPFLPMLPVSANDRKRRERRDREETKVSKILDDLDQPATRTATHQ